MKPYSLFFLLLFLGCQQTELPNHILPIKKMCSVVKEITLLETHFQSKYGVPSQYKSALDLSVKKVFKKAHITRKQFQTSLDYYAAHPELQKALNEQLLMELSRAVN
ncbi:MAG: DUF4296 domain-containing protein [Sphingomonadales bacterium]|nr:DUF4296 domain-containing protein [Sphingomonadales bacterium]